MSLLIIIRHNQIGRYFVNYFCFVVLYFLERAYLLKGKDFAERDLHKEISYAILLKKTHSYKEMF